MTTLQMEQATPTANLVLEQTRVIRAARERVYAAWTNPETLKQWFGSAASHCPSAQLDVRVDGEYRIEFAPNTASPASSGGECSARVAASGRYTEVVPNQRLQFTWIPSFNPAEESLVTVLFRDAPGGTEITLRHERFASEQSRDGHNKGWSGGLDKLAAMAVTL